MISRYKAKAFTSYEATEQLLHRQSPKQKLQVNYTRYEGF